MRIHESRDFDLYFGVIERDHHASKLGITSNSDTHHSITWLLCMGVTIMHAFGVKTGEAFWMAEERQTSR